MPERWRRKFIPFTECPRIAAISAVEQSGVVNATVDAPPSVRLTTQAGLPAANIPVTFSVMAGGGSTSPAAPTVVATDNRGIASLSAWTLGREARENILTASAADFAGSPITFIANAVPASASVIVASSAVAQSGTAGVAIGAPPSVRVADIYGNGVSGILVAFAVTGGGGSVAPALVVTGPDGVGTVSRWTLGTVAGSNTLTATSAGLGGSPVTFSATGTVGTATQVVVTTQPSGAVSAATFITQPVVEIRDAGGNVVAGSTASVTASIASGTGTLVGTTTVSAVNGVATFASLRINGSGAHTLRFTASGLTSATSGSVTVTQVAASLAVQTQPSGAASGAAFTTQPVVRILDNAGLVVTTGAGATLSVTAAVASGTGTLGGTTSVTAVNGVATFTNLALTGAGAHTLTFTTSSPSLNVTSSSFGMAAGAASQIVITTQPAGAVSGVNLTTPPVVEIRDAAGNVVTTSTASVTVAIASGTGAVAGTTTVSAVNGVATFSTLKLNGSGAHTLTFAANGLTSATSASLTATQAAASLSVPTQPGGAASGSAFTTQPVVRILDNAGLVVTTGAGATLVVTASKASGTGVLSGTATATAVNGVATFAGLTLTGSGSHALSFTTSSPSLSATSASFTLTAGPATTLVSNSSTSQSATAGITVTAPPSVRVTDASGNVVSGISVTFAVASGGGTTTPASPAVVLTNGSGVATLTAWTLGATVGPNTVTATAAGLTGSPLTFTATGTVGTANQVAITTQPSGAVSGVNLTTQPVVEIRDAAGNLITGSTISVTASIASGTGSLVGTTTVSAVNGVATFASLRINGSGAHTLRFAATGLTSATSASLTATQVAASLSVQTQPAGAASGAAFTTQPVVRILDNAGLVVTTGAGATLSVTSAVASGTGALGGTVTVTAVSGVATFTNLALTGAGSHTLAFTTSSPSLSVTSSSFGMTAGAASQVAITTQPAGAVSGVNLTTQPVVQIRDAAGNVVTGSTASVTASIASGTGSLVGTTTVSAVNGVATFASLRINGSGAHTLTFAAAGLTSATSASLTVTQVAASLSVQTQPAGASTGSAFTTQPVIRILDNAGLAVTTGAGATLVVTASKASGSGTLGGTATATAVNGVATFTDLAITGTGAHTLQFATTSPVLTVTSSSVTVAAAPATQLAIATQPAGAVSGVNLTTQPVVQIRDANGNVVTGSTASVTAAIASGTGTLVGTTTVSAVNGVATFGTLRLNGSGAHTLTFTASGLTNATSASLTATQVAASLSVQTQPAGASTGSAFTTQPVIRILDNAGLAVTTGAGATLVVTASKASGSGTLGGTATATAVNGVATFTDLAITGTGAHTLQFATTSPVLTVTSSSVTVAAAPATQLAIATQPAGAVSGVNLTTQPVVQIRDANGNVVTGSTASVTAAIASGTGTLVGTTTVSAVNGVATFGTLRLNGSGAHTLIFTASGLTSATSGSLTVTQVAASLVVQTQPAGATTGTAFTTQPVVRILDNAGLVVTTGAGATLVVTASKASGSGTLGGTATTTAVNGVATFADLAITGTGAHALQFATASPTLTVTSSNITVASLPGVYLNVSASATTTATVNTNITVPLLLDLSNRGSLDIASLTVTVTWDPAKFTYVSNAAGNWTDDSAGAASVTVNATNAATGTLSLAGFTSDATTSSFTLRSITLRPLVSGSGTVSASVGAAGNVGGSSITVTPRNLAVTINP